MEFRNGYSSTSILYETNPALHSSETSLSKKIALLPQTLFNPPLKRV